MKKILSFAVALVMLLTMSIPTFAIYDGAPSSVGSVDDPDTYTATCPEGGTLIEISTEDQFMNTMEGGLNKYYYLSADLDFTNVDLSGKSSVWSKTTTNYILNLDGCGHTIRGIDIETTGDAGVFARVNHGTIQNLTVQDVTLISTGKGKSSGFVAVSERSTISSKNYDTLDFVNVKLENLTVKSNKAGGFCAYSNNGTLNLTNCYVSGLIDATGDGLTMASGRNTGKDVGVGGFLGQMKKAGIIKKCTNYATVKGKDNSAGGFIGRTHFGYTINDCINNGKVENKTGNGDCGTGGFIGNYQSYSGNYSTLIQGCVNNGEIRGERDAGGFLGSASDTSTKGITIRNCINAGDVFGGLYGNGSKGAKAAGFVAEFGAMNGITISGCVNRGTITGGTLYADDGIGAIIGGAQTTTTTMTGTNAEGEPWTIVLQNNSNEGVVTNTKEHTKVSTLAGFTAAATVEASGNTSTTKAVGTLATAGKAYIQFAEADTTSDVRFILALDESAVANVYAMNLNVSIGDVSVNFDNFGTLYRKLYAADLDIKGGDGVVLYGLIVTGVPNNVWSEISIALSATDSTGTAIDALSVTGTYTK